MQFVIILIFIALFLISFKRKYLLSPWIVTIGIWTTILSLYSLLNHGLYPTTGKFELAVLIWVCTFTISSIFGYKIKPIELKYDGLHNQRYKYLQLLAILLLPLFCYIVYKNATSFGGSSNVFFNLRVVAVSSNSEYDIGPVKYVQSIVMTLLLVACNENKPNKKLCVILLLMNFCVALAQMAKIMFFFPIVSASYILIANKKMSLKYLVLVLIGFLFLVILFDHLRSYTGVSNKEENELLAIYLLSPIVAFDIAANNIVHTFGTCSFVFFCKIISALGLSVDMTNPNGGFLEVPYPTNVYTVFYDYFCDFGYLGVFIFAIIDGILIGYVYKLSHTYNKFKVLYAYFFACLALQFFSELFFTRLSLIIQVIVFSMIIYSGHKQAIFK